MFGIITTECKLDCSTGKSDPGKCNISVTMVIENSYSLKYSQATRLI